MKPCSLFVIVTAVYSLNATSVSLHFREPDYSL